MQGLADGYFVIPYTLAHFIASNTHEAVDTSHTAFAETEEQVRTRLNKLLSLKGEHTVDDRHRQLGHIMWQKVGMSRNAKGLGEAIDEIKKLRQEFWHNTQLVGEANTKNIELEKAGRVADFLELAELQARDALDRRESCGGHFREEHQTPDNEALRDDANFSHASAWQYQGKASSSADASTGGTSGGADLSWHKHKEELSFEYVKPSTRSYK